MFPVLVLGLLGLVARPAGAEVTVRVSGEQVDLTATAAPLADVLDRLGKQTGMKVVYEGPAPRQRVTLTVHGRSAAETVLALFEGLGLNYALVADPTGAHVQTLIVAGTVAASSSASTAAAARATPARRPFRRPPYGPPPGASTDAADAAFEEGIEEEEPPEEPVPGAVPEGAGDPNIQVPVLDPATGAPAAGQQDAPAAPGPAAMPAQPLPNYPVSPFAPQPPQPFPPVPPGTPGAPGPATNPPQQENPAPAAPPP
jgi:hypothetical protein